MIKKNRLFRYSGSKNEFIDDINLLLSKYKSATYIEPFIGSGAIYLNTVNQNFKKFYINDFDRNIVHIYKTFKEISYKYFKTHFNYVMNRFGDIGNNKQSFINFRNWFNKNVWMTNSKSEGVFLMMLASSCINSFFSISKNGFNSSYGNRNYAKNYTETTHNNIRKRLNNNTIITNLDFFDFIEFLKVEEKDTMDNNIVMMLDPPYVLSGKDSVGYMKNFDINKYNKFIDFIKSTKYNIIYTDVKSDVLDWKYFTLRKSMVNTSPNTNKFENNKVEVAYYNN